MSGEVNICIRKKGKLTYRTAHTGQISPFINNAKLFTGDRGHLQSFRMRTEQGDLCFYGYGLIVVDYDTKTIIDSQNYVDVGDITASSIFYELSQGASFSDPNSLPSILLDLIHKKLVAHYDLYDYEKKKHVKYKVPENMVKDDLKNIGYKSWVDNPAFLRSYLIDNTSWEIINLDDSWEEGATEFKKLLLERGFPIDDKIWNSYYD